MKHGITEMTNAEMNRRIAEMDPKVVAHIERLYRDTTYTAREIWGFSIPGSKSLAHINAVFQKAKTGGNSLGRL